MSYKYLALAQKLSFHVATNVASSTKEKLVLLVTMATSSTDDYVIEKD